MTEHIGANNRTLPIVVVLNDAVGRFWEVRLRLATALVAVVGLMLIFGLLFETLIKNNPVWYLHLFEFLFSGVLTTLFGVTCHRVILLGNNAVPRFGVYQWSARETRFLFWTFVCFLALLSTALLLGIVFGALTGKGYDKNNTLSISFIFAVAVGFYLFARFSVLLPAIALGKRIDFGWAWSASRGNGWRLALILGFIPATFSFLYKQLPIIENIPTNIFLDLTGWMIAAFDISILSTSYRYLADNEAVRQQT